MKSVSAILLLGFICSCNQGADNNAHQTSDDPPKPSRDSPLFQIVELSSPRRDAQTHERLPPSQKVIFRLLADGTMDCINQHSGTRTQKNLSPSETKRFMEKITGLGFFDDGKLPRREWIVLHSTDIAMSASWGEKVKTMTASREYYQGSPSLWNRLSGVLGRSDSLPSNAYSDDYRRFKKIWDEIMRLTASLCSNTDE